MAFSLFSPAPSHQRAGVGVLRIVTGLVFLMHGYQKVFVYGLDGTAGAFAKMGVFLPGVMGPFIALLELLAGVALVVGVLTRLAALGLALDMLGAVLLVHLAGGFFLPTGYEYALVLLAACVALACAGPGALSIDDAIAARRPGPLGTCGARGSLGSRER
jgi:putative oxidoreductase